MNKQDLDAIRERYNVAIERNNYSYAKHQSVTGASLEDIPLLLAEIDRLQAERDAAVEDLREISDTYRICAACKFLGNNGGCREPHPGQLCANNGSPSKWQWRGVERGAGDERR